MKIKKASLLLVAAIAVAALLIGASSGSDARPPSVPSERWIAVGDKAGFAITSQDKASIVVTTFYVKTEKGWLRARVDSPVSIEPLGAR